VYFAWFPLLPGHSVNVNDTDAVRPG